MGLMWVVPLILQFVIILAQWRSSDGNHFRIFLDEHESVLIPKRHSEIKILTPLAYGDKLFGPLPKINKKPLKYAKHPPVLAKLKPVDLTDVGKKCCGNKWALDKEVSLEELIRPVSLPAYLPPHAQVHAFQSFDDVKPVTEIIEDDIKYDFRTKTHSLR